MTREDYIEKIANIIRDMWPHRMSYAAAEVIYDTYIAPLVQK